jgi:hypothetical protein
MAKKQERRVGDVVRIGLDDSHHGYARVLPEASFAVYDYYGAEDLSLAELTKLPILFRVAVMDWAVKKGRWTSIGNAPLEPSLLALPPKFIQDKVNKGKFSIYENGQIRPASKEECLGLESAAVWDPSHVEDRVRDHYAGRSNKWVESLKIKE